jgi:hypothetical protein
VHEPIPDDPDALANQLYWTALPWQIGPITLLTGIGDIATVHYVNQAARAATLRMLARVPEMVYHGETRDIAGRPALTWSVNTGVSSETITFDATTGQLLAHRRVWNTEPPMLLFHTLYLGTDRRADLNSTVGQGAR